MISGARPSFWLMRNALDFPARPRKGGRLAQRFHIEFAGGVLHARRIQRKNFSSEQCVDGLIFSSKTAQRLDDGYRQRRAFSRVGSRAQLVHKHQRLRPRQFQDSCDVFDVP